MVNLRRSTILGGLLSVVSIVLLSFVGHPLAGVFGAVGIGLGALNNRMLQRSVIGFATDATLNRAHFRHGVLLRLGLITILAIGVGLIVRPDGLGVFAGLAAFQILMLIGAAVPVFRSLRPTA